MRYGEIITLATLNDKFRRLYTLANGIVPDLSLLITTAQIRYIAVLGTDNNNRHFPSKFGVQYFENDSAGLITAELKYRIDRILGE